MSTIEVEEKNTYPPPVFNQVINRLRKPQGTTSEPHVGLGIISALDHDFGTTGNDFYDTCYSHSTKKVHYIDTKNTCLNIQRRPFMRSVKSEIDAKLDHLKRLTDGWDGGDTCAPSPNALEDFAKIIHLLGKYRLPNIEIEEEGGVSLFWHDREMRSEFSLTFRGTKRVVGTLVSLVDGENSAWRVNVDRERQILGHLQEHAIEALVKK